MTESEKKDDCCYQICFPKHSNKCDTYDSSIKSSHFFKSIFVHNSATNILLYMIIAFLIATCFALYQEIFATQLDELYAVDYWSVAHTFYCFGFYIIIYLIFRRHWIAFLIVGLFTTLFEPWEWWMAYMGFTKDYYFEVLANRLVDIVFNFIGIFAAYFLTRKQLPQFTQKEKM